MRNSLNNGKLAEQPAKRAILALTLSASLAAFACTTNRTPGSGEPMTGGPAAGPTAPTSGATSGTSGASVPGPMTSSYRGLDVSEAPLTRADRAAAIVAEIQPRQAQVLGPVNPSGASATYTATNNAVSLGYPGRSTVNSSLSSAATEVVSSGMINGSDVSSAAPTFPATAVPVTPTNAALPLSPGVFASGDTSVAANSGAASLGVVNAIATPAGATTAQAATVTSVAPVATSTTPVSDTAQANTRVRELRVNGTTTASATSTSPTSVRVMRSSSGRVVVTNNNQ